MRFRRFDDLRLFDVVARHRSFTAAASELSLSKGAVSYRIAQLEQELDFPLFDREHGGVVLTTRGAQLWHASQAAFHALERDIERLRGTDRTHITIGTSTYFASRWLSQRLMRYITAYPYTTLRLQPLVDLFDLESQGIDMAIRWGRGDWKDLQVEPLFACPAFATAGAGPAERLAERGLANALADETLLHDRDDSDAWRDWYRAAGLPYRPAQEALVIPDPNVRVQAVINGQGIALNDALVASELASGALQTIAPVELSDYGYFLVYADGSLDQRSQRAFRDWILEEALSASAVATTGSGLVEAVQGDRTQ